MFASPSPILRKCWAESSECSGALTKEHVVSASILRYLGPLRTVKRGKTFNLGVGSYVVRNLCARHNGLLSRFDSEALRLFKVLSALAKNQPHELIERNSRGQLIARISGRALERWFAKTFMNSAIFEASALREQNEPFQLSSHSIGAQLFGEADFRAPFGLRTAKPGFKISSNPKPGIHTGLTYAKIEHHTESRGWAEFSVPIYYYIVIHGCELLGFFNSTSLTDDFALAHWLEKYSAFVAERTIPLPFKIGFNLRGESGFGPAGPQRVIDMTDSLE